jgi:hypothetical protein
MQKRQGTYENEYRKAYISADEWYTRGRTKYGHPKHLLYVSYDEEIEWFPVQD